VLAVQLGRRRVFVRHNSVGDERREEAVRGTEPRDVLRARRPRRRTAAAAEQVAGGTQVPDEGLLGRGHVEAAEIPRHITAVG